MPPAFRNNFDLLRFILAALVVPFHLLVLSASPALRPLRFADGGAAVLGFFAISGYVVTLSLERSRSLAVYAERRARRLLPGYYAVVLFCFLAGSLVSSLPAARYWTAPEAWKYLAANFVFLQFLQPSLPGVFAHNPTLAAVNGSLWSIRTEILCYLLLPAVLALRARLAALALCLAASAALAYSRSSSLVLIQLGLAQPLVSFFAGALLARSGRKALPVLGALGLLFLLLRPASFAAPLFASPLARGPLMPIAVAFAVLAAGLSLPYLGDFTLLGDLSYGVYLWHFPIVQFAVSRGWLGRAPWPASAAVFAAALLCAALSWRFVERPLRSPRPASSPASSPPAGPRLG